jgi:prepilin-type processing-associated H-X9-DG protein
MLLKSRLGIYTKNPGIYKCPADRSSVANLGPRVRSVSMNSYIGGDGRWNNLAYREYHKMSDIVKPPPVSVFVFLDERNNSIDDGFYAVGMPNTGVIVDCPGSYHNGAGGLSFADGHAEIHKWRDPSTKGPPFYPVVWPGRVSAPNDMAWLAERTTALK